jgi:hypothetical protein
VRKPLRVVRIDSWFAISILLDFMTRARRLISSYFNSCADAQRAQQCRGLALRIEGWLCASRVGSAHRGLALRTGE